MGVAELRHVEQRKAENTELKRRIGDPSLDTAILQDVLGKDD